MFDEILNRIESLGVVPVVVINDSSKAVALAKAILDGGINCIEVTFRTSAAEESIKLIHNAYPEMILGAGTVINLEQAEKAVKAGASFIVSPGLDEEIVEWCKERDIAVVPGVCTASEVQAGIKLGLKVLKFFPAEAAGGVKMIKNLCGPFPQVKFMTTGGISLDNIAEYAACPHVTAIGGSWMTKANLINEEKWTEVTKACNEALKAVNGFELAHFGINTETPEDAKEVASKFNIFGMTTNVGSSSTFMDTTIELMHGPGRGAHGHIGFRCFNVERAMAFLATQGFTPIEESKKFDEKGNLKVVFFNEEVAGFSLHLVKK